MDFLIIILLKDMNCYRINNLERLKRNYTKDEIDDFISKNPSYKYDEKNNTINISINSLSLNEYV